jgi:hypothetical protein
LDQCKEESDMFQLCSQRTEDIDPNCSLDEGKERMPFKYVL